MSRRNTTRTITEDAWLAAQQMSNVMYNLAQNHGTTTVRDAECFRDLQLRWDAGRSLPKKPKRHEHRFITDEWGAVHPCRCGAQWQPEKPKPRKAKKGSGK